LHLSHLSNETPIEGVVIEVLVVVDADAEVVVNSVDDVIVTIFVVKAVTSAGGDAIFMILGLVSLIDDLIVVVV
jgi:hypothetical protein